MGYRAVGSSGCGQAAITCRGASARPTQGFRNYCCGEISSMAEPKIKTQGIYAIIDKKAVNPLVKNHWCHREFTALYFASECQWNSEKLVGGNSLFFNHIIYRKYMRMIQKRGGSYVFVSVIDAKNCSVFKGRVRIRANPQTFWIVDACFFSASSES